VKPAAPAWVRVVVDGAPAIAFLGVLLVTHDFRKATWVLVIASVLALGLNLAVEKRIAPLPAFSGGLALLFGVATLLLHRNELVKMKMTIVDGLLGAALFIGLLMGKNPLKMLLGGALSLSDRAWRILAVRYGVFWWACAGANEWVRHTFSDADWAKFRVAVWVAAVVFALAQTPFLMKHGQSHPPAPEPPDPGF
jgi:intracellular septation protein